MAKEGLGLEITELRLGLPGGGTEKNEKKRVFSEISEEEENEKSNGPPELQSKSQVVGWPPVCSYRKKNSFGDKDGSKTSKFYVKVSMDGAPFLRKINLALHKGYSDLVKALEKLFGEALRDAESCEFVPIYEDKDGDWMLAGDVPWEMFIESCKRLRIMKKADAKGFGVLQSRVALNGTLKE
ncbi:hypothetical protein E1A91_A05G135100v1 [Gossypium mustelinum]|uniref:Auxin-responsive protein n=1 Tax=Gossypium mustelinum TaxID=34275 RepID=A0A5D2Z6T7_GOSMU|nr:hypothetical protein E1A91_A05G135100v1 [Gossypium mustelinum]